MSRRIVTIEDGYEYHVHRIIRKLIEDFELGGWKPSAIEAWMNDKGSLAEVGKAFLDDLESWSGVEAAVVEATCKPKA